MSSAIAAHCAPLANSHINAQATDLALLDYFNANLLTAYSVDIDMPLDRYIALCKTLVGEHRVRIGVSDDQWAAVKAALQGAEDLSGYMGATQPLKSPPASDLPYCCGFCKPLPTSTPSNFAKLQKRVRDFANGLPAAMLCDTTYTAPLAAAMHVGF